MVYTETADLTGLTVVVTRPAHQAEALVLAIEAAGGEVLRFPVLAIAPPPDPTPARARLVGLATYDWVIFVSANAVSAALALTGAPLQPGPRTQLAAIGAATAAALTAQGLPPSLRPAQSARSETLLDTAPLQAVRGQRILLVRGVGGREHLYRELTRRGAQVSYAECYQRVRPDTDPAPLAALLARRTATVISVTSVEGLRNLLALGGTQLRPCLLDTPLLVVGPRQRQAALESGWRGSVLVAPEASVEPLLATLHHWRQGQRK